MHFKDHITFNRIENILKHRSFLLDFLLLAIGPYLLSEVMKRIKKISRQFGFFCV